MPLPASHLSKSRTARCQVFDSFRQLALLIIAVLALPVVGLRPAQAGCADVALVLAIDASGSISDADFWLQINGYHSALNHSSVMSSFSEAGVVDIAAVFWADSAYTPQTIPWHRIAVAEDVQRFAHVLASTKREVSGNTDIGSGLMAAIKLFEQTGKCADRSIIDLSGDGRATVTARRSDWISAQFAKQRAEDLGITVNALAITSTDEKLADYYRTAIATGPASFVMEADSFLAFQQSITEKLSKELLSGHPIGHDCAPDHHRPAVDACRL